MQGLRSTAVAQKGGLVVGLARVSAVGHARMPTVDVWGTRGAAVVAQWGGNGEWGREWQRKWGAMGERRHTWDEGRL